MTGGSSVANPISVVRSQLHLRRFDEGSIEVIESILASKDVKSLVEARNALKKLLRSESKRFLGEIAEAPVGHKLLLLQFFVRAFALAGDVESCLALRYEALLLRDRTSVNDDWLRVSHQEWFYFAQDSFLNGFYSIALLGCEKALSCIPAHHPASSQSDMYTNGNQVVEEIKKLKNAAVSLNASHSVRAQAIEHLRNKTVQEHRKNDSHSADSQISASSMFRNGIKRRNLQKLRELQSLQPKKNKV